MYTCKEKAVIFIDGFINLEYKHKRAIINLYDSVDDLFNNPNKALNYVSSNLGENASNAIKLALNDNFLNQLLEKYLKRDIKIVIMYLKTHNFFFFNLKEKRCIAVNISIMNIIL